MRYLMSCLLLVLSLTSVSIAQTSEPQTPGQCLATVQNYTQRKAEAARKASEKLNYRQYQAEALALARSCAAKFPLESAKEAELIALANLYKWAQQFDQANAAIQRRLASSALTADERATALNTGLDIVLSAKTITNDNLNQAEKYVAQLDTLPGVELRQQINAHSRIGGYYSYADLDAKNLEHHEKIIALINKMPANERKPFLNRKASAFESIALVHANRGQADKAVEILKAAAVEMADVPNVTQWMNQAIKRYSQIGQAAPALKAAHWINGANAPKELSFGGRITLLQFTAHWCIPCRNSYPAIQKLHDQFAKQGLEVIFSTQLYGYFSDRNDLKPEEEIEADREYYATHHHLPFKVAIEPQRTYPNNGQAPSWNDNESSYFVGGIPQMVLIDKQGIIRLVMIGWDPANETKMTTLIEKLLSEPAPSKSQK